MHADINVSNYINIFCADESGPVCRRVFFFLLLGLTLQQQDRQRQQQQRLRQQQQYQREHQCRRDESPDTLFVLILQIYLFRSVTIEVPRTLFGSHQCWMFSKVVNCFPSQPFIYS